MVLSEQEITLSEHHIYGSSRLGYKKYMPKQVYAYWNKEDSLSNYDTLSLISRRPWYSTEYQDVINGTGLLPYGQTDRTTYAVQNIIGQKQYEFTNHLGNVLATTSDLPYRTGDDPSTGTYTAALKAVYDYYPFGSLKPGRFLSDTTSRCVTYTQSKWVVKTKDSTYWLPGWDPNWFKNLRLSATPARQVARYVNGSNGYQIQIIDTAIIGSTIELEQTLALIANETQTIVVTAEVLQGAFVLQAVEEVNGNERLLASTNLLPGGSDDDGASVAQNFTLTITPQTSTVTLRLSSPASIGNVSTGVTQIGSIPVTSIDLTTTVLIMHKVTVKVNYLEQEQFTVTLCDSIEDKYRFGFNGMEKDNELKGVGNSLDFGARMYDSRIGRWLSLDPLAQLQPNQSPYKSFLNNPILMIDPDGKREFRAIVTFDARDGSQTATVYEGNTIMTDGVKHIVWESSATFYRENRYYDYTTLIHRRIDKNNKVTEKIVSISILKGNGIKQRDAVWFGGNNKGDWQVESVSKLLDPLEYVGGVKFYGSGDGSLSPGSKSSSIKDLGTFDFAAFSDMFSLITVGISEPSVTGVKFDGESLTNIIDNAKNAIEQVKKEKAESGKLKPNGTFHCITCGDNYKVDDSGKGTYKVSESPATDTLPSH